MNINTYAATAYQIQYVDGRPHKVVFRKSCTCEEFTNLANDILARIELFPGIYAMVADYIVHTMLIPEAKRLGIYRQQTKKIINDIATCLAKYKERISAYHDKAHAEIFDDYCSICFGRHAKLIDSIILQIQQVMGTQKYPRFAALLSYLNLCCERNVCTIQDILKAYREKQFVDFGDTYDYLALYREYKLVQPLMVQYVTIDRWRRMLKDDNFHLAVNIFEDRVFDREQLNKDYHEAFIDHSDDMSEKRIANHNKYYRQERLLHAAKNARKAKERKQNLKAAGHPVK